MGMSSQTQMGEGRSNELHEISSSPSPPVQPAPQYQSMNAPPRFIQGSPPPGPTPTMSPQPMSHQQHFDQPMYQQQETSMTYFQQQPNATSPPPNQPPIYPQQIHGQPPPQEHQGGPQQNVGGGKMNDTGTQQYRTVTAIPNLGRTAAPVDCPRCETRALTKIDYHVGNTNHVWGGITCWCTWCLCFIPYLMDSLKDVDHKCGNCGQMLATWHNSGHTEPHAFH